MKLLTVYRRLLLTAAAAFVLAGTAHAQRTFTLHLNTSTLPDTIRSTDVVQVWGTVDGEGNVELPDGNVIDWSENSTVTLTNVGGDYWTTDIQIPDDAQLDFKFFVQASEERGVGGLEAGDPHTIPATAEEAVLVDHFFEKGDDDQPYNWRLWEDKDDTVAVYFRVWMNTTAAAGYDRADDELIVGVRGNDLGGVSPLSWDATEVVLTPESDVTNEAGYHMFSGIAYFPTELSGTEQAYAFVVGADGREDRADRTFTVPSRDTTLQWVYFADAAPAIGTSAERNEDELPGRIRLEQNYPNPFNPQTTLQYALGETQHVRLRVFDPLGRTVATLVDRVQPAATHQVTFDASHLASGVYVYRLEAAGRTLSRTMVLAE